jgi:hypothetical protein
MALNKKFEGCLDVLSINAAVFLIGHARAVIDDGKQHQARRTRAIRIDPRRRLELFQVRRAQSKYQSAFKCSGSRIMRW